MADPALPRRPSLPAWLLEWLDRLRAILALFAAHATAPFESGRLPNWYVYGTFVLLLVCILSIVLNVLLLSLFIIARYG